MKKQARLPRGINVTLLVVSLILFLTGIILALADFSVSATVETEPIEGDTDDPAIWIHPSSPTKSLIIGTVKGSGLAVYDVIGNVTQLVDDSGGMNNVDLRYNFPLNGESVDLVVATNRDDPVNTLAMYKVNAVTNQLENVTAAPPINSALNEVYGTCMYVSPKDGKYYAFITSKQGIVEQWQLVDNGSGKVDGIKVRTFDVGTATEGCVADDVFGDFYVGEEDVGVWKYGAEPGDGTDRVSVDDVSSGRLEADIEGLAIYYTSANTGYLLVSSQGSSEYVVYDRVSNAYLTTFDIVEGNGIDGTSGTDGIDVTNASLGPIFPQGVFVAHDGNDDIAKSNFKFVPWPTIANGAVPPLTIDTTWDPRSVGFGLSARFNAKFPIGPAPLTVIFTNLSTGFYDFCLWEFGDGATNNSCDDQEHTYISEGFYDVSLIVVGVDDFDRLERPEYVWVGDFELMYMPVLFTP
ncbi:MAG: phytase [Candidatus Promineifilaceae bacterium]|nr:phytase [Candidatus Promineifilaceae bacterium]